MLVKAASVVQITGLSEATIRRWEREGRNGFPGALRRGKRGDRYWDEDAVKRWVEGQDGHPTHPAPPADAHASECTPQYTD